MYVPNLTKLEEIVMADGTVYIDTEVNSDGFGKAFDGYSEDVKKTASELYELVKKQKEVADAHKQNTAEVNKTSAALDKLIEKQIRYIETGGKTDSRTFLQMEYDIEKATAALDLAKSKQAETAQSLSSLNVSVESTRAKLQEMASQESRTSENASMMQRTVDGIKKAFKNLVPNLAKATKSLAQFAGRSIVNGIKNLGSKIKQMAKSMLTLRKNTGGANTSLIKMIGAAFGVQSLYSAIRKSFEFIKEGMNNLVQYSGETNASMSALKSSLTQLKNSFATAFAPILNVIAPILTQFIDMLSKAASTVGAFFSALSGKGTYTRAVAVQEDYAESLNGTSKAADKAKKSVNSYFSGLDEIKTFTAKQEETDTGVSGISPADMFEEVEIEGPIQAFANKVREVLENIKNLFLSGDWEGLGTYLAEGLNKGIEKLYEFLKWENAKEKILPFINGFTQTFNSFIDNFNFERLGETIGTGINTIIYSFDELITGIDWANLGTKLGEGVNGLFSEIDFEAAGKTFSDSIKGVLDLAINFIEETDWQKIGNSVADFLGGIDWSGIASRIFEGIGAALGGLTAFIWGLIQDAWNAVVQWWYDVAFEDGKFTLTGLLEGIWEVAKDIGSWLMENVVNPFINGFKEAFGIHSPSTVMAEFGTYIMQGLINGIEDLFNKFKQIFVKIKNTVINIFTEVKNKVISIWDGIISGIKKAINGIIGAINGMISGITNGINNMISALNSLKFDVPDWVPLIGGKEFSLNISKVSAPQIPYLATGAVIPPNAPFMAVLGDQKHGTNIEAPLDTIKQAVREVVGNSNGGTLHAHLYLDGREVLTSIIDMAKLEQTATGINPLLLT